MVVRRASAMPLMATAPTTPASRPISTRPSQRERTSERAMAATGAAGGARPIVAGLPFVVGHDSGMVPEISAPSPGADRHSTVPPMAPRRSLMFT